MCKTILLVSMVCAIGTIDTTQVSISTPDDSATIHVVVIQPQFSLEESAEMRQDCAWQGTVTVLNNGWVLLDQPEVFELNSEGQLELTPSETVGYVLHPDSWHLMAEAPVNAGCGQLYSVLKYEGNVELNFSGEDTLLHVTTSDGNQQLLALQDLTWSIILLPGDNAMTGASCESGDCGDGASCQITCPKGKAAICYCDGNTPVCKCVWIKDVPKQEATIAVEDGQYTASLGVKTFSLEENFTARQDCAWQGTVTVLNNGWVLLDQPEVFELNSEGQLELTPSETVGYVLHPDSWHLMAEAPVNAGCGQLYSVLKYEGNVELNFSGEDTLLYVNMEAGQELIALSDLTWDMYQAQQGQMQQATTKPSGPSCQSGTCPGGASCSITCPKGKAAVCYCDGPTPVCKCVAIKTVETQPAQGQSR